MVKKIKKESVFAFLTWILIIGLVLIIFFKPSFGNKSCPDKIEGNSDAPLKIKYFESPYCVYCWLEEPKLKSLLKEKGTLFSLERYDLRFCHNQTKKYGISGTPSFVFSLENGSKEYTHYGFLEKEQLEKVVCEVTEAC